MIGAWELNLVVGSHINRGAEIFQGGDNILVPKFSLAPHIHKSSQTFISNFRGAENFQGVDNILVPKFSLASHIHKSSQTFISKKERVVLTNFGHLGCTQNCCKSLGKVSKTCICTQT